MIPGLQTIEVRTRIAKYSIDVGRGAPSGAGGFGKRRLEKFVKPSVHAVMKSGNRIRIYEPYGDPGQPMLPLILVGAVGLLVGFGYYLGRP